MPCPCECIKLGNEAALLADSAYEVYRALTDAQHWRQQVRQDKLMPLLKEVFTHAETLVSLELGLYEPMSVISALIGEVAEAVQKSLPQVVVEAKASDLLGKCAEVREAVTKC